MAIYSKRLGSIGPVAGGTVTVIYTVPAGQGPAIVRSVCLAASAFSGVKLEATDSTGTTTHLAYLNNQTASEVVEAVLMNQPLEPTSSLTVSVDGGSGNCWVIVGGYQFTSP